MRKPLLPQALLAAAFLLAVAGLITNGYRIADANGLADPQDANLRTTTPERAREMGCLSCHEGIEAIREEGSDKMAQILAKGEPLGDPGGCVVCHGGNPAATTADEAHRGIPEGMDPAGPKEYYPDPGSLFIADNTCGQCHPGYVYRLERGLMNTEAGKIQGNLHTWGIPEVQNHKVP